MLGQPLFLIYTNYIIDGLASLPLNYVHDTTLFRVVDKPAVSAGRLNYDLNKTSE